MKINRNSRTRTATRIRTTILKSGLPRISVHKSSKNIYVQIFNSEGTVTLASASTLDKDIKSKVKSTCSIEAAQAVAKQVASKAKSLKIEKYAFDRSGFLYHGRVAAVANTLREEGLNF